MTTPGRSTPCVVAMLAALLAALLAGCGSGRSPQPPIESTVPPAVDAAQKLVGPGCAAYVKAHPSGRGSVAELADKPVAEAIASQPMLKEFAAAIGGKLNEKVDLTRELDSGEFTVFAPVDDAFRAKVPRDWARTLSQPGNADALTDVLLFHLVVGERDPDALQGDLETRSGQRLTVQADGDRIRVNDQANVVCGGFHTSNATIYLIDSVLMPNTTASPSPSATGTPTGATATPTPSGTATPAAQ